MAIIDDLKFSLEMIEASGDAADAHAGKDFTETSGIIGVGSASFGACRDLEAGFTEYFERSDEAAISSGDRDWCFAIAFRPESTAGFPVIAQKGWLGSPDGNSEWVAYIDDPSSRVVFALPTGSVTAINGGALSNGTDYLLFIWHDSVNNQIGAQLFGGASTTPDIVSHSTGTNDGNRSFQIGASTSQSLYFDGFMGKARFWHRVPTASERAWMWNRGALRTYAELVVGRGYILNEKFTTGVRPTDFYNDGTGINYAYATAPAPLEGAYSVRLLQATNIRVQFVHGAAAEGEQWGHFTFHLDALPTTYQYICQLQDSSFAYIFEMIVLNTGVVGVGDFEGGHSISTVGAISAATTYHVFWRYKAGSGSNSEKELWICTTNSRAATPAGLHAVDTAGAMTTGPALCQFAANTGVGVQNAILDDVQWADADVFADSAQYARPTADSSAGGWAPSVGVDLFAVVDESVVNDADYMTSGTGGAADPVTLKLDPTMLPPIAGTSSIILRHRNGA